MLIKLDWMRAPPPDLYFLFHCISTILLLFSPFYNGKQRYMGLRAWKCFKREAGVLKKSLPLMPTYYFTLPCLAAACANLFCKLYAAVFCEPPTKTLKKWYCFFRNNDWLQILSSWLWRGGGWEKYWNEHGLFFVQKMSVYICSMSDGCNLEKVYWRWVFLFSLHPHITTHWE